MQENKQFINLSGTGCHTDPNFHKRLQIFETNYCEPDIPGQNIAVRTLFPLARLSSHLKLAMMRWGEIRNTLSSTQENCYSDLLHQIQGKISIS